jgi:hypothetical protein
MTDRKMHLADAVATAAADPQGPIAVRFFCPVRHRGLGLVRIDPRFGLVLHLRFEGVEHERVDRRRAAGVAFIPDPVRPPAAVFECKTCERRHAADRTEFAAKLAAWRATGTPQTIVVAT